MVASGFSQGISGFFQFALGSEGEKVTAVFVAAVGGNALVNAAQQVIRDIDIYALAFARVFADVNVCQKPSVAVGVIGMLLVGAVAEVFDVVVFQPVFGAVLQNGGNGIGRRTQDVVCVVGGAE